MSRSCLNFEVIKEMAPDPTELLLIAVELLKFDADVADVNSAELFSEVNVSNVPVVFDNSPHVTAAAFLVVHAPCKLPCVVCLDEAGVEFLIRQGDCGKRNIFIGANSSSRFVLGVVVVAEAISHLSANSARGAHLIANVVFFCSKEEKVERQRKQRELKRHFKEENEGRAYPKPRAMCLRPIGSKKK